MTFIRENKIYLIIIGIILLISFLLPIVLYFSTGFEKTIIIKEKYTRYRKNGSNYNIVDNNNNVYQIGNLWFKGDFNRAEDYALINEGDTLKVKGYGIRIPFLDMYQQIYEIEQV